ncbi:MAG TPA: DUF3089 domain-containing protein [Solirubrobacterales bacterium]
MIEARDALRIAVAAVAAAFLCSLAAGATAEAKTAWLCKPGLADNPCDVGFDTTTVTPAGEPVGTKSPKAKKPKVDCFYVYPTVSDDEGPNSDLEIDPEERSVALYQASRYSQHCRVFAPMYRQITLAALFSGEPITAEQAMLGYRDVLAAWRTYLKKHNDGRGVVFVGHSQGTLVLRNLLKQEVDPKRKVRRRVVSALLFGGNVLVAKGERTGGDFEHIPSCRKGDQTGCVIAFSTFDEPVPADARFGRPDPDGFFGGDPATEDVLCTDPTKLDGSDGALRVLTPSEPFAPGSTIAAGTEAVGLPRPEVATTWIEFPTAYTGGCSSADDAHVLQIAPQPGAVDLNPIPNATWGLHLLDANVALGNLVDVAGRQARAYARRAQG